jgi:hypothetical protein
MGVIIELFEYVFVRYHSSRVGILEAGVDLLTSDDSTVYTTSRTRV